MNHRKPRALTTQVKDGFNAVLRSIGLRLETTRKETHETARLMELSNRGHWSAARYAHGLRFEPTQYREFLNILCSSYRTNFPEEPPASENGYGKFYLHNGWFESVDAEVLYGIVRHFKPKTVMEIGSGFSTRVVRQAILDGGLETKLTSIDPKPRADVGGFADDQIPMLVESIDPSRLVDPLHANDILFIDSSHLITTGGDVPYLCLEVIPKLREGVFVHFHDIFLPFEYPQSWVVDFRWGWNEQYLVQAFLYNNSEYEIVWPAHYMWTQYKGEVLKAIACDPARTSPSSFWLKKIPITATAFKT